MYRVLGVMGAAVLAAGLTLTTADDAAALGTADPAMPLPADGPSAARAADDEARAETGGEVAAGEAGEATADPAPARSGGGRYDDLIRRHAEAAGVPVGLARAVVRIESNFNSRATGRAGEVGLMQIKPRTARGIGFSGSTSALYDPDTNLRWGMKYLAGAYRLADGDLCGTVMRYQGGHYARRMSQANRTYCNRARQLMASGGSVRMASN